MILALFESNPRIVSFHSEIYEVLKQKRFDELTVAEILGVLELVKFELIQRTPSA